MKFQIVSDLHVDFKQNFDFCLNNFMPATDNLIVAGDTAEFKSSKRNRCMREIFLSRWKNVYEVPGNHDNYDLSHDWPLATNSDKITSYNGNNHYYYNNKYIDIGDVRLIFSTLYSLVNPSNYIDILRGMMDFRAIRGYSIDIYNQRYNICNEFLIKTLDETYDKKCVIITHHLPLLSLIEPKFMYSSINDCFAVNMMHIIKEHSHKIPYWIHGHSHGYLEQKIEDTIFLRNPLGYLQHNEGKQFNGSLVIDI